MILFEVNATILFLWTNLRIQMVQKCPEDADWSLGNIRLDQGSQTQLYERATFGRKQSSRATIGKIIFCGPQ